MNDFVSTALKLEKGRLLILDQTRLPQQEVWLESRDVPAMIKIIKDLSVRGAPLIGVAAALQLGLLAERGGDGIEQAMNDLYEARPTAVNLMNAIARVRKAYREEGPRAVPAMAELIAREDVALCDRMAKNGAALIKDGARVLTHCNTGGLATAGLGTALGAMIEAQRQGKKIHVIADETRPLLQGGRLTAWELNKNKIPFTLICDSMAGFMMQQKRVDLVMVGADRIARNGDFANKVGTYSLAVLCRHHQIPFYVVAPQTTVDPDCDGGAGIPIEERSAREVHAVWNADQIWNPAFDVTPHELVTGWVLDRGVFNQEQVRAGALLGD